MRKKSKINQDDLIKFGQWLSDQRRSAALTMAQLSLKTGVSRSTILNLENGKAAGLSDIVKNTLEHFFSSSNSQSPIKPEGHMENQQGHFGDWVKAQRELKKLNQKELADAIGVSTGSISAIESGKARSVGEKMIAKIRGFFSDDSEHQEKPQINPHEHLIHCGNYASIIEALGAIASSSDFRQRVSRAAEVLGCSEAEAASAIFMVEVKKLRDV